MIDIIGTIYSGGEWDEDGNVITEPTAEPGWHVNAMKPLEGADEYIVEPASPKRVFGGGTTIFYQFPDEATARSVIGEDEEGSLSPTPKPDIESIYRSALSRLFGAHSEALADIQARYPQTEREGWRELILDAQAGAGACIEAYAAQAGLTVGEASTKILEARDGYRSAYGAATGRLAVLRGQADALYQAGDVSGLKSLTWDTVLG